MIRPLTTLRPGWLCLLLLALVAAPLPAQQGRLRGLDAYIEQAMKDWKVPGLAVAVVQGDSLVYARGFGVREAGTDTPVDANTIFAIGSSSKAFTAAALGLLVDEGKVQWDDPVGTHLPQLQLHDPYVTREITVRDLLSHRTGVGQAGLLWTGSGFDREDILRRLRFQDRSTSLRSQFGYNNEMYLAAGQIVPAVTGASWDRFLEERIFAPLGMTRSSTSVDSLRGLSNVASPHVLREGRPVAVAYRHIDNIGPAGSINSSARDVAQWVRLHLGRGTFRGREILSEAVVREMHSPQMVVPRGMFAATTPEAQLLAYGLGWFLHEYRGSRVVEHGGAIDGMHALVGMIPEQSLGIVVLTNRYPHNLPYALMYRVFDAYLGEAQRDWSGIMKARADSAAARVSARMAQAAAAPTQGEETEPTLPLAAYAGVYESPLYGTVEIVLDNGALVLRRPDSVADLEHGRYDAFVARWRSPGMASVLGNTPVQFTLGHAREVVSLSLAGLAADFARVPASPAGAAR